MRVALVYNQKKEDSIQRSQAEDESEPPSLSGEIFQPSPSSIHPHQLINPDSDIYAEWDTFETIDAVRAALAEFHEVSLIEANEEAYFKLMSDRPDIVFNIAEGFNGVSREAQIPAMMEMLQLPYTGSDPLTLSICLDKSRAKEILSYYNIPTPRFTLVSKNSKISQNNLKFPFIVKPLHEGSSKGIFNSSIVNNQSELEHEVANVLEKYRQPALVEEFLSGREFTVAILGNGDELTVLPIVEIKFDTLPTGVNPIYSYEAKWIWDRADAPLEIFACPAKLSLSLQREIESVCCNAYSILHCRDWCRIDVRLDAGGKPHIIELNPLPGILPKPEDNSCFPKAARAAGMNYNQLIQTVLTLAAKRYGLVVDSQINPSTN
jgi:D-alanine-D-alanine ligase